MQLSDGIRRIGFRKWYERTLLASHAHLVLCFLCLIGVFAAFEAAGRFTSLQDRLTDAAAILACTGVGVWALRRYLGLMARAESAANQAECPHCRAYARLDLRQANAEGDKVEVRCRSCGHGWTIEP
ncbi:MAG: MJ0042-type zinc finger domain-containing protein [Betaproteobacteria bacterium]